MRGSDSGLLTDTRNPLDEMRLSHSSHLVCRRDWSQPCILDASMIARRAVKPLTLRYVSKVEDDDPSNKKTLKSAKAASKKPNRLCAHLATVDSAAESLIMERLCDLFNEPLISRCTLQSIRQRDDVVLTSGCRCRSLAGINSRQSLLQKPRSVSRTAGALAEACLIHVRTLSVANRFI